MEERAARLESIKQGQAVLSKFFITHEGHSTSNAFDTVAS